MGKLNRIRISIIATICLVAIFSYLTISRPLQEELKKTLQQNFIYSAEAVAYATENFIENSMDAAANLSDRTMLKEKILEYRNGMVTLQELIEYTKPKYNESYKVLESVTRAVRIVDGQVITQQGQVNLENINNLNSVSAINVQVEPQNLCVAVYSPIKNDEEVLGHDIIFFNLTNLLHGVHEGHMLHELYSEDEAQELLINNTVLKLSEGEYLAYDSATSWYMKKLKHTDVFFVASSSNEFLYSSLKTVMAKTLFGFPGLILLVVIIINYFTFKVLGRLVRELEKSKEMYKELASIDCLTDTSSRHFFNEQIEKYKSGVEPFGSSSVLIMIDVDNFKEINDTYGHLTGDEVLKAIAGLLKSSVRDKDKVVRYGGDEFLLILNDCDIQKGEEILSRVNNVLKHISKFDFTVELSYGISEIRNKNKFMDAVNEADARMYEMKKKKKKS